MAYVETRDHTRLFYCDAGDGRPIVFCSSAWLSSRMWEFQVSPLVGAGFRCITYDRRGHGRSDWTWDGYDYDTLADDLAALIEQLDLRDITFVAHSAGGGEVVRYLTRHGSGRVKRIALIACVLPAPLRTLENPDGIERALIEPSLEARTADRPKWYADNADSFFGVGLPGVQVSPELEQYMIQQCLDCSPRATREFFLRGFSSDFRAELRSVERPTLIVHGDHDAQAPLRLCGLRTAQLVPKNELIVYENAAHGLFVTHARRLNADLAAFAGG